MKLEVSLFRFDHKSDYLPYYTKHIIKIENETNLLDVFTTINENQPFHFENSNDFIVSINGVYTHCDISVDEIKETFGKEITIEPMSIRRAHSDLLINDEDFQEKFELISKFAGLEMLASYTDKETIGKYNAYKIYFYASNTLNYEANYIGDAVLLLAYDLIEQYPKEEKNILKAINDYDIGIEYHTNLSNRIYNICENAEAKIASLKEKLNISKDEQNFRVNNTYIMNFSKTDAPAEIKHDFTDFNLAYYTGLNACDNTTSLLDSLNAKVLNLSTMKTDLALDTFHVNPDLTYKLVSTIMLDAYDQNANLLIVDSEELFYLFDYNRKELKRVSGRDIEIPVLHASELEKLAFGAHGSVKETLNKHIVNPELI